MSAVTKQEIVEALKSDSKILCDQLVSRIEAEGIEPSDNVKQADKETHRRVDEAVRNGRIEDRRAGGKAVSREEIIRMAKAFAWMREGQKEMDDFLVDFFKAAYAAGAAAERDACAMVCDAIAEKSARSATEDEYEVLYPRMCAAAIRARGDK